MLLEGDSDSGKSVLCQHLAYGAVRSNVSTVYYSTENTAQSLIFQMRSLNLEVTDFFLSDIFRVYPLMIPTLGGERHGVLQALPEHFYSRPPEFSLFILDSATGLTDESNPSELLDFFLGCKTFCVSGKSVIAVVDSNAFSDGLLARVRSLCDVHLILRTSYLSDRLVRTLEVPKILGVGQPKRNHVSFEIELGRGMKIINVLQARA